MEPGQTLFRISRLYGITVEQLQAANGLKDGEPIAAGQSLIIPRPPKVEARGGIPASTLDPYATSTPVSGAPTDAAPPSRPSPDAVVGTEQAEGARVPWAPAPVPVPHAGSEAGRNPQLRSSLDWPLRGVLYARFGRKGKEPHDGIDLSAPAGTPVKVANAGKVLFAGEQQGYGQIVIVDHGVGLMTVYAHNGTLRVRPGQQVRASQVIATVGESGHTSGPHLHFEVRQDGVPVDPLAFLKKP